MSITRREALAAAAAFALARPAAANAAQSHADRTADALRELMVREQAAAFAYALAGLPRFARQEEEHAQALLPHLESVGHRRPARVRGADDLDRAAAELAGARGNGRADAAVALEESLLRAYAAALDDLYDPATRRTAATIMASHGQHLVLHARDPLRLLA